MLYAWGGDQKRPPAAEGERTMLGRLQWVGGEIRQGPVFLSPTSKGQLQSLTTPGHHADHTPRSSASIPNWIEAGSTSGRAGNDDCRRWSVP